MKKREEIIQNYIDGYNEFNVEKMTTNFSEAIVFENMANGAKNMSLIGVEAFKQQAEAAKNYFSHRKQTVKSVTHREEETEIEIEYEAMLKTDLPNGLKKGEVLKLGGWSVFKFSGDKIVVLTDIS